MYVNIFNLYFCVVCFPTTQNCANSCINMEMADLRFGHSKDDNEDKDVRLHKEAQLVATLAGRKYITEKDIALARRVLLLNSTKNLHVLGEGKLRSAGL